MVALIVAIGVCEALGWPFLVAPLQSKLASALDRKVEFGTDQATPEVRIGLIGSVRVRAARIEIGAPSWSTEPYTFLARNVALKLRYSDLWRVYRGGNLRIDDVEAAEFNANIERLADGRASWQFNPDKAKAPADPNAPSALPTFGSLRVANGNVVYRDAMLPAHIDARFALNDSSVARQFDLAAASAGASGAAAATAGAGVDTGASGVTSAGASGVGSIDRSSGIAITSPGRGGSAASAPAFTPDQDGLQLVATGEYRKLPVRIDLHTGGVLRLLTEGAAAPAQPLTIDATIGRARLTFDGSATDPTHFAGLRGSFSLAGPSLAAAGDPLGVTLPTTPAFSTSGYIVKDGDVYKAVFSKADIGSSHLNGAFTFDKSKSTPILSGRLGGSRLELADLGPAVGGGSQPATLDKKPSIDKSTANGKVIPDRDFDLPALRAMDANVLFDIAYLDLGTTALEPLKPLRTHLTLKNGVLRLDDIDARTAQGELLGNLQLDGRGAVALWNTDLRLRGVALEHWLHQKREGDAPPYISGKLDGQIKVAGRGKSTAEILGSLNGGIRFHLRQGTISHLAVEAVGIDIAQALGMLIKGDDSLKIQCNLADLAVDKGVASPKVFVITTADSTVLIDGTISLQSEAMDLRAVVSPKDFSPFALRTPIHVKGTLGSPKISLEAGKLAGKAGAAVLLSLLNPIAALIPFIDTGSDDAAKNAEHDCDALVERSKLSLPKPAGQAANASPMVAKK